MKAGERWRGRHGGPAHIIRAVYGVADQLGVALCGARSQMWWFRSLAEETTCKRCEAIAAKHRELKA